MFVFKQERNHGKKWYNKEGCVYICVYFLGVGVGHLPHNEASRSQILKSIFLKLSLWVRSWVEGIQ